MRCLNKRGQIAISTLIELILLTAFLVIALGIFWLFYTGFTPSMFSDYSCWMNNAFRESSIVFKAILPESCEMRAVTDPITERELALLLRDSWWMYGRGKWDIFRVDERVRVNVKYAFKFKDNLPLEKLGKYLITHKRGERVSDVAESDFAYIQSGALGNTICFHNKIGDNLAANKDYYIIFYDDRALKGSFDKLLISSDVNFGRDWGERLLTDLEKEYCKPLVVLLRG